MNLLGSAGGEINRGGIPSVDKLCSKCRMVKSAENFSKNRNTKDGLDIICKDCKRAYQKERRQNPKPISVKEKVCLKCGILKPTSDFYKDLGSKDGLQCYCISCRQDHLRNRKHIEVTEKRCNKCGNIKPIDDFYSNKNNIDDHIDYCKNCFKLYSEQLKSRPKEQVTEKECHKCHVVKPMAEFIKDKIKIDGHSDYCKICTGIYKRNEHYKQHVSEYEDNLKREVLTHYSPNGILQCSDPYRRHKTPEIDLDVLSLDHINGGGNKELKLNTKRLYYRVKQANYPNGFQTLCFSCQMKKKLVNSEQPKTRLKKMGTCNPNYEKNRDKIRQYHKKYITKLKIEALRHYSPNGIIQCLDPYHKHIEPETDIDVLCLDHINGDGYKDTDITNTYVKLKRNNYLVKLQVLCASCNNKKRLVNKENGDKNKKGK